MIIPFAAASGIEMIKNRLILETDMLIGGIVEKGILAVGAAGDIFAVRAKKTRAYRLSRVALPRPHAHARETPPGAQRKAAGNAPMAKTASL